MTATPWASRALDWIGQGHAAKAAEHAVKEAAKLGHFRGGSAGLLTEDGTLYGKCPRVAYLRSQGLEEPVDDNTREVFEAGYANEVIVLDLLRRGAAAHDPDLEVADGDGIALTYQLPDGTPVSCRPDALVRVRETGQPVAGFEFKMAASLWSWTAVHYDRRPRSDHLIQAGHYSLRAGGAPFVLLYSCRAEFHLSTAPKWLQSKFPPGVYDVEYKDDGATPLKLRPANRAYELTWRADGRLQYWTDGLDAPVPTEVTADAIERYYLRVAEIRDTLQLGPRPSGMAVDGSKSFMPCDYCDLKPVCDAHEATGATWLDHARLKLAKE